MRYSLATIVGLLFASRDSSPEYNSQQGFELSAVTSPYITTRPVCTFNASSLANVNTLVLGFIDSVPNFNKYPFYRYFDIDFKIPNGSLLTNTSYNSHVDHIASVATAVRKVNKKLVPNLKGIRAVFRPAISSIGTAYEPNIIASLKEMVSIAKKNAAAGRNSIFTYAIGGTYESKEKVALFKDLLSVPRTIVIGAPGNNEQRNYCSLEILKLREQFKNFIIVGGTIQGDKLSLRTNIGACVGPYAPYSYISVLNGLRIYGDSFAIPIIMQILALQWLNAPSLSPEEVVARMMALTSVVNAKTIHGTMLNMNVFPKKKVCSIASPTASPTAHPPRRLRNKFKN